MCPVVLTRGGDQEPLSTKFDQRSDPVPPSPPPAPPAGPTAHPVHRICMHLAGLHSRCACSCVPAAPAAAPGGRLCSGGGGGAQKVIRSYGKMVVELAAVVPDGLVCFFVSYRYMDQIVAKWNDMGILNVPRPAPPPAPPQPLLPRELDPILHAIYHLSVSSLWTFHPVPGEGGREGCHSCCSLGSRNRAAVCFGRLRGGLAVEERQT